MRKSLILMFAMCVFVLAALQAAAQTAADGTAKGALDLSRRDQGRQRRRAPKPRSWLRSRAAKSEVAGLLAGDDAGRGRN